MQSAIDLAATDANQIGRSTGLILLSHLSEDPDITPRDLELIRDVADELIDEVLLEEAVRTTKEEESDLAFSSRWFHKMPSILSPRRAGRR